MVEHPTTTVITTLQDSLNQEQEEDMYENYGGGGVGDVAINLRRGLQQKSTSSFATLAPLPSFDSLDSIEYNNSSNASFYDEDGTLSAFGIFMSVFAFGAFNTFVVLRVAGLANQSLWGHRTDHTSPSDRIFQGLLAIMGILAPILFVIKFLTSTEEVLIIIGCGVLLPYGMAAILALICYKEEEEQEEQDRGPANKSDTEEDKEPDFNLIGHHNQRRSQRDDE